MIPYVYGLSMDYLDAGSQKKFFCLYQKPLTYSDIRSYKAIRLNISVYSCQLCPRIYHLLKAIVTQSSSEPTFTMAVDTGTHQSQSNILLAFWLEVHVLYLLQKHFFNCLTHNRKSVIRYLLGNTTHLIKLFLN